MSRDQITVFIPIKHYHEGYLRQAIDSVFRQTRSRLAASAPRGRGRAAALSADAGGGGSRPPRPARAAQGRLLAGAYNSAMREAETEFIAALLGDDLLAPDAVQTLGEHIAAHPRVDFFHSGRYFIDGDNRRISSDYAPVTPVTAEGSRVARRSNICSAGGWRWGSRPAAWTRA